MIFNFILSSASLLRPTNESRDPCSVFHSEGCDLHWAPEPGSAYLQMEYFAGFEQQVGSVHGV